jgi:CarD family transcriptional regulator, regulator of rRNA transcription
MFRQGDAVVHPARGVGVVEGVIERQVNGATELYYKIRLSSSMDTMILIPVSAESKVGLRLATNRSRLIQVWKHLRAAPNKLPADHKERYKLLEEKLQTGNVMDITEVVRDMSWRQCEEGQLKTVGKRIYQRGLTLLAGEVAAALDVDQANALSQIQDALTECQTPASA